MAILPFLHFSLEWQKKEKGNKILEKGLGYKSTVWAQKTGINRRKNISYICSYWLPRVKASSHSASSETFITHKEQSKNT